MHIAYIAMGGNLPSGFGGPEATLTAAALRLQSLGCLLRRSSLYSTAPVGFADQPRFFNAVVALETQLPPLELLRALLAIEQEFGRDRSSGIANGPRTLDLDLLLCGDQEITAPELDLPHPRLADRAFVLVPLNEIAPRLLVPGLGQTVADLLADLAAKSAPADPDEIAGVLALQTTVWPASGKQDVESASSR